MPPNSDDIPISVIEDLDPEPDPAASQGWWRSPHVREIVLGLLLLVGVLGWAGYTSWRNESNSTNYAQGQRDEALRNWDEALAHYSAASGYRDADARAADVTRQIQARDKQYAVATAPGPAAQVLLAARAVQTIEPGYKDADSIAAQAEDQAYTDALSGTVVLRSQAQPPGLYYRGPGGWIYLRDSDQWSSVLSIPFSPANASHIVYDVPGPDWKAPGPLIKSPFGPYGFSFSQGSPDKVGRRLVAALLPGDTGQARFINLRLNPMSYNFYICGNAGVWGIRYDPGISDPVIAKGIADGFSPTYEEFTPQGPGLVASTVAPVAIPGNDGVVADFGHGGSGGDRLLLAAHGMGANKATTQLFITRADGSDPHPVYSTTGKLISALLSPDDRHALVVDAKPLEGPRGWALVVATLLTLDRSEPPAMLQKVPVNCANQPLAICPGVAGQLSISGVFLENGAFKNRLLIGWTDSPSSASVRLQLLDVSRPDNVLTETEMLDQSSGGIAVVEPPDGQALLLYDQDEPAVVDGTQSSSSYLEILRAGAGAKRIEASNYTVPVPVTNTLGGGTPYFMEPTLREANLIYNVETFTTMPDTTTIYSIQLVSPGTEVQAQIPMQIYSRMWPDKEIVGASPPGPVGVAGPRAYAYEDSGGTLHAHLYDSQVDVPLEAGVGTIFALDGSYFYKTLH